MKYIVTLTKESGKTITRTLNSDMSLEHLIDDKIKCEGFDYASTMLVLQETSVYEDTHNDNQVKIEVV